MVQWFLGYSQGYTTHTTINFRIFSPSPNARTLQYLLHISPKPQLHATTHLLSVSMGLPVLDVSFKWNHTICDPLRLASFTQHVLVFRFLVLCVFIFEPHKIQLKLKRK